MENWKYTIQGFFDFRNLSLYLLCYINILISNPGNRGCQLDIGRDIRSSPVILNDNTIFASIIKGAHFLHSSAMPNFVIRYNNISEVNPF